MILLDTHIVLWLAQVPEMLSPEAHTAIAEARQSDGLAISDKTLWEIALLVSRGQVRVRTSLRDFLAVVERTLVVLPVDALVAERSVQFSTGYPKDPADRIIGATALVHATPLVTADKLIRASGEVPCIW